MKRFMEWTVQFKLVWSLFFTASILLYVMIGMFFGESSMDYMLIWQLVLLTMILTLSYYLFFADFILESMSTRYKVLLHALFSYIILIGSAWFFGWINLLNVRTFTFATFGYVLLYLSMILSFYIYHKTTGEELNDKLASYKKKKNMKK